MKKLKTFISFICILLMMGCGSKTTNESKDQFPVKNMEFLNGLTKVDSYEIEGMEISSKKTLVYTEDGRRPTELEIAKMMQSGNYSVDPYRNKKGEIIWLLQPITEMMKKAREYQEQLNKIKIDLTGKNAVPFSAKDMEEKTYSLENLKGKVIVMNFWFIACGPCVAEIPQLNELVDTYKKKDVVFLGFANDKKDKLIPFLKKKPFHYTILPESEAISGNYSVRAFPTHIVIDKNAIIKYYYTGGLEPNTLADLKKEIDRALSE